MNETYEPDPGDDNYVGHDEEPFDEQIRSHLNVVETRNLTTEEAASLNRDLDAYDAARGRATVEARNIYIGRRGTSTGRVSGSAREGATT